MFGLFKKKSDNRNDGVWKKNKKKNPYKNREEGSSFKRYLLLFSSLAAIAGIIYFLLFHPFFEVDEIKATGLKEIKKESLISSIKGIISHEKYYFLSQKNFFLLNKEQIKQILKQKYPIRNITINKSFPDTLKIDIEEKVSTIIYDNGAKYAYLSRSGEVTEIIREVGKNEWKTVSTKKKKANTSSKIKKRHIPPVISIKKEMGKYPIIYDKNGGEIKKGQQVLSQRVINGITEWYSNLSKTDISFEYATVATSSKELIIYTDQRWHIKTNPNSRVNDQFKKLNFVLNNKLKQRRPRKYIDVKYADRVYWK
ncbi:MAG: cell division protein FtsQ/DivIB [Candidatus Paceibacteria bacterium]